MSRHLLWFLGWRVCCCGHLSDARSEDPGLCYQSWSGNKQSVWSPASPKLDRQGCVPYLWTLGEEGREPEQGRTLWERTSNTLELIASSGNNRVAGLLCFLVTFLGWFYFVCQSVLFDDVAVFLSSFISTVVFGLFDLSEARGFSV